MRNTLIFVLVKSQYKMPSCDGISVKCNVILEHFQQDISFEISQLKRENCGSQKHDPVKAK